MNHKPDELGGFDDGNGGRLENLDEPQSIEELVKEIRRTLGQMHQNLKRTEERLKHINENLQPLSAPSTERWQRPGIRPRFSEPEQLDTGSVNPRDTKIFPSLGE